eukprot:scaffold1684_cov214-Amphora_coffeaeformis.AAC.4
MATTNTATTTTTTTTSDSNRTRTLAPPTPRPLKIVVAGGGIAGNVFVRSLLQRTDWKQGEDSPCECTIYEARSYEDASPPGVNVLMNHNGLAAIQAMDPELYEKFLSLEGSSMVNWSARDMQGNTLYHLPNVVKEGLAKVPSLVARWNEVHEATRVDALTKYGNKVVQVKEQQPAQPSLHNGSNMIQVQIQNEQSGDMWWETDIDFCVAADGRYSTVRQQLAPSSTTYYGPPAVIDYRIVVHDFDRVTEVLSDEVPMWRVYHKPNAAAVVEKFGQSPAVLAAAHGQVRVGLMKLGETTLGVYGNIALPDNAAVDDCIKDPAFMAALFLPNPQQEGPPDAMGQMVLDVLRSHGQTAYWARKQQTDTCYTALNNRVLFIGDSAGGIYPSLGQGANLSLEDAVVAATVFPNVALVQELRHKRRDFIKNMSRYHAKHIAGDDHLPFTTEVDNWARPDSAWRLALRELWSPCLALRAQTATPESFAPFGQLIGESLDGDLFDPTLTDADLDLSQGKPRLYYMKLTGGRPLRVNCITRHNHVTQCLGALGNTEDFYLVVHRPDVPLSLQGLKAFRIPSRHFVKLQKGTWHVGPLWTGSDSDRTFVNLELADTNVVDHDMVPFCELQPSFAGPWCEDVASSSEETTLPGNDKRRQLTIPIMPAPSE